MNMPRRSKGRALIGLALTLGLSAACAKSSTSAPPTNGTTVTTPASSAPATTPMTTAPPTTSNPSGAGTTINQGANGFTFSPATLSVKTGTTLTIANVGSAAHTFTITGHGINVVNNPGQTQQIKITLPPGTYPFVCTFHVSLGMKGTITITP
jgi:plastocyanin